MKRMKIVGLALVALFAMSAVLAAGSASAAPVFKTCVKATEKTPAKTYTDGEYSDKNCGKAAPGGKYKLGPFSARKSTKITIKGGHGANRSLNPETGKYTAATECSSEKGTGELTETGATFKVEYKGCKNETKNCQTEGPGAKKGVVIDQQLKGTLVDLPEGKVGLSIENAKTPEGELAGYNCEGLEVEAVGGVIGEVTGGRTEASKTLHFIFQPNSIGKETGTLQQWLYPSASFTEVGGLEEASAFLSQLFKGEPITHAKPTMLFSVIDGGVFTLPSIQGSTSETKEENLKIVG
jgi:hypothetical protein